jgi:uncharacterized SAM-binding protein YcdF (DUF218 family)
MNLEAIVVLGCALKAPGVLGAAAARRVERAFLARADGVAERIVVSGGRRWFGVSEAEAFGDALRRRGVPESSVLMELCSFSTAENASFTAELFQRHGLGRAALVTCDWHMPRALACFERVGFDCRPFPASSPELGALPRAKRRLRERASFAVDRVLTFGF